MMFVDITLKCMEVPDIVAKLGPQWDRVYPQPLPEGGVLRAIEGMAEDIHDMNMELSQEEHVVMKVTVKRGSHAEYVLVCFIWPMLEYL